MKAAFPSLLKSWYKNDGLNHPKTGQKSPINTGPSSGQICDTDDDHSSFMTLPDISICFASFHLL